MCYNTPSLEASSTGMAYAGPMVWQVWLLMLDPLLTTP
jgi:hypothetical protein